MDPTVRQLWADQVTHTQYLNTLLRANFYACSLELCTKTYEKGELRVHCHCFFYKENKKIHVRVHDLFRFQNSLPNVKADRSLGRNRGGTSSWSGAYYVQGPKIGSVFQTGTGQPFEDYPVAAKWIFQLVQMQKITFSAARAELVKTGENLCKMLPDLDRHHAESTAARLHQRAAAV